MISTLPRTARAILALASALSPAAAQAGADGPEPAFRLWPGAAPGEAGDAVSDQQLAQRRKATTTERIHSVADPTLTVFPAPARTANGAAVVVCPGGGYNILAWPKEGTEVARWLNSIGVTAAVLKYRVPRRDPEHFHRAPLQDAQRALRLVRHRAGLWAVDPARIGILGFSAGGHLSVTAATHWDELTYPAVDAADQLSARPDFVLPIYPAYLGLDAGHPGLSPLVRVSTETPPVFIAVTWDDKMRAADAALLLTELHRHNVPAELHAFAQGGHGYGLRPSKNPVSGWPRLAEDWMRAGGWLGARRR